MTDTVIALFLLCVLIFLLGRKIGQMNYEQSLQNDITRNGCFMLDNGFYRAIKLSKYPVEKHEMASSPTLPHVAEARNAPEAEAISIQISETSETSETDTISELTAPMMPEVAKKPIRRRNVTRATH